MNKPASLRSALEAALPELARSPDRLLMFIEKGSVKAFGFKSLSFEYGYTLTTIITDYAGHPDAVMIPVLAWLRENEPPLLQNPELMANGVAFEAEILSHKAIDLQITLKLTERVGVRETNGVYEAHHFDEPPLDPYQGIERLQVYVKDELVYDSEQPTTAA